MIYKTLLLCDACRQIMSEGFKLTELPDKNNERPKVQACENCGTRTAVTLCTIRSGKGE